MEFRRVLFRSQQDQPPRRPPEVVHAGHRLLPAVWRYAKENRLHSQSDFFVSKYRSTGLGVVISLVTVLAMVPYLAVQFQGLGIIVSEASYGSISSTVAVVIGVVAVKIGRAHV